MPAGRWVVFDANVYVAASGRGRWPRIRSTSRKSATHLHCFGRLGGAAGGGHGPDRAAGCARAGRSVRPAGASRHSGCAMLESRGRCPGGDQTARTRATRQDRESLERCAHRPFSATDWRLDCHGQREGLRTAPPLRAIRHRAVRGLGCPSRVANRPKVVNPQAARLLATERGRQATLRPRRPRYGNAPSRGSSAAGAWDVIASCAVTAGAGQESGAARGRRQRAARHGLPAG